jgi:hypothetical protein
MELNEKQVTRIVARTVRETLIELGIAHDAPLEMQKDFQVLREWRLASEAIRRKGVLTVFGIVIAGITAAFWVGLKQMLSQ